ncbi:cell division protein FtsQ/DivIB [Proteinivorax tanatarense]|uniref:Cell division protein FtsQ/DivIB n=1 Tax=Proteinivorax tanatarense TaxID=1260629 RepID=A0AAU7VQ71_9FIRM
MLNKKTNKRNVVELTHKHSFRKLELEKKKARRLKIFKSSVSIIAIILLISLSIYAFLNSPLALITDIEVQGNFLLDKQEILDTLPKVGQANFYAKRNGYYEEILNDEVFIKEFTVDRNIFHRTVIIDITERTPLFKTVYNDEVHLVCIEGVILPNIKEHPVPYITGIENSEQIPGLVEALSELDEEFVETISEINITKPNKVQMQTVDNFTITVGTLDRLTNKRALEASQLMDLKKNKGKEGVIDIRGREVTYSPSGGE